MARECREPRLSVRDQWLNVEIPANVVGDVVDVGKIIHDDVHDVVIVEVGGDDDGAGVDVPRIPFN